MGDEWADANHVQIQLAKKLEVVGEILVALARDANHDAAADLVAKRPELAQQAHARGLAIGLKNAADMVPEALPGFDFAITEDCFVQGWGERVLPFITAGKAVFAAEYTDTGVDFQAACAWGGAHNIGFIQKNRILTAFRNTCS